MLAALQCIAVGCSESVRPEPVELKPFEPQLKLQRIWKYSTGTGQDEHFLQYAPFIDNNAIFAINYEGTLVSFGATTGLHFWTVNIDEPLIGGVGGDDQQVYITTVDGELIAVDRVSGDIKWRSPVASEVLAPAVTYKDLVIVKTINVKTTAFDTKECAKVWEHAVIEPSLTIRGSSQPIAVKDAVISGMSNGTVTAVSAKDGQLFWEQKVASAKGKTELERLIDIDGKVVLDGDSLFAVAYQGQLTKLQLFNGKIVWTLPVSSRTTPGIGYANVFVSTTEGDVVAFDKITKREAWRQSALAYRELTSPVIWGNYLLVGDMEGYIHLLSQASGTFVARIKPASEYIAVAPVVYEDRFIVLASNGQISAWSAPSDDE